MQPEINQTESRFAPLQKVTPLSKYLAMALFVLMPFIGGWIGYTYAPEKVVEVVREVEIVRSADVSNNKTDLSDNVDVFVSFDRPVGWRLYAADVIFGGDTQFTEYRDGVSMIILDGRTVWLHEVGRDPSVVRIQKHSKSVDELVQIFSSYASSTKFEQVFLHGKEVTKVTNQSDINDCSAIFYIHPVDKLISVSVITDQCPGSYVGYPEGYHQQKKLVAESVKIIPGPPRLSF